MAFSCLHAFPRDEILVTDANRENSGLILEFGGFNQMESV